MNKQIKEIQNSRQTLPWVVSNREPSALYYSDGVSMMKGVGKVTTKKLNDAGIMNIRDVLTTTLPPTSLSVRQWFKITAAAYTASSATPPPPTDHRLHDNPYESLYSTIWEDEIKKTNRFKGIACVTDMVTHIYNHSKAFFAGTRYESI